MYLGDPRPSTTESTKEALQLKRVFKRGRRCGFPATDGRYSPAKADIPARKRKFSGEYRERRRERNSEREKKERKRIKMKKPKKYQGEDNL